MGKRFEYLGNRGRLSGTADQRQHEGSELKEKLDDNWKMNPNLRLNALRWSKGMTQKELSEATGLNRVMISQLENGRREISLSIARKLAPALGCSYKDLL